jgi:hypothetical protein
MLKLTILLVIIIGLIGPVFSLNSTDLCYSTKYSACKGNHSYQCAIDVCSLNKEACDNYNKHKRSYTFRSLHPLIKFQKEIKLCEFIKSESGVDLNKYCLNRNDCFETNKLVVYGITVKNEVKQVDCKCQGEFKYQCNRNYCANDSDSCEFIHKLNQINKVKDCNNKKIHTVIHRKGLSKYRA